MEGKAKYIENKLCDGEISNWMGCRMLNKIREMIKLIFPDKKTLVFFLFSLFILISLFSAGFYLNDEMEQGTCFYNLLHGDLTIEEIPEHYYVAQSGIHIKPRYVEYGGHSYIGASHGMAVFSVPFYYFLLVMDYAMGIEVFFIILWSALLAGIFFLSSEFINKHFWPEKDVKKKIRAVAIIFSLALLFLNLWLMKPLSFEKWGAPLSMQFTSICFTSLGLAVLFRFFRFVFNEKIAFFGSLLLLVSSPVAFWAMGQKYHGLNFALLVFSFASFYYGKTKNNDRYRYAGYVFASLAVWVQLYSGIVILLSLLLLDFLTIKKRRLTNTAKIFLVVFIALTPYFVENYAIYDNPLYPGYIAKGNRNVIPPNPPEIEVLSPHNGESVSGETIIHYNLSSNAEESVIKYANGSGDWIELGRSNQSRVTFLWNTTNFEEGIGVLGITAWNWRNDITQKNISVIVDSIPPRVKIVSPQQGLGIAGSCTLRCNVSSDVAFIDYYYSNREEWIKIGNDSTPYDGFIWNTTGLQGTYDIMAVATDHVGFNNSSTARITVDNSGKQLILQKPQDGTYIGGDYEIKSVIPPDVTRVVYEYRFGGTWHLIGNDNMKSSFIWNTSPIDYGRVDVRAIAYHDEKVVSTDVNKNITIDNTVPTIKIIEPERGEDVKDFALVRYNTSNNTAFVKVQYSTDNKTWETAGVDLSGRSFIFPAENHTGHVFLRATAFSMSGLNSPDMIMFNIVKEKEITAFGKITFILNSINVGWNFLKLQSVLGEPEKIPVNFYKSFFNARGTDAHFAFFVFVPFLILSFFAPISYLKKKRKFGVMDGLMLSYIALHLFIFLNISIHQGGGHDMRFYLPLHLPFLYFGMVVAEEVINVRVFTVVKTYLVSLVALLPLFLFVDWITTLNTLSRGVKANHFFSVSRIFSDVLMVVLFVAFVLYLVHKRGFVRLFTLRSGREDTLKSTLKALMGIALFSGTMLLALTMILYSRGLPVSWNESNEVFSLVIPVAKSLQELLQNILI